MLPAHAQDRPSKAQPFTLAWTEGKCKHCGIARQLGEISFTSATEAWAVGFSFPYHGQGTGDYVMVHSIDGGRNWKELHFSRMHASGPTFSFLGTRRGWVSAMAPTGESSLRQTTDGGFHWKALADEYIEIAKFFGPKEGYGVRLCETGQHCFSRTSDGGRTWHDSPLPQIQYVHVTFFLDARTGWIAGKTKEKHEVVLRTTDGGRHWDASMLPVGEDVAEVRDLFFLNPRNGWLITWAFNDGGTRLYQTIDGGKSWTAVSDSSFQGERKWLSVVRFLNDRVGFAFNSVDTSNDVPELPEGAVGYERLYFADSGQSNLLYTRDGGEHWESFAIPRRIYDCQVFQGDLLCSALSGESGLWLVKVHPSER